MESGKMEQASSMIGIANKIGEAHLTEGSLVSLLMFNIIQLRRQALLLDGLRQRLWQEEQLVEWDKTMDSSFYQPSLLRAVRKDAADKIEFFSGNMDAIPDPDAVTRSLLKVYRLLPAGWLNHNKANYLDAMLEFLIEPLKSNNLMYIDGANERINQRFFENSAVWGRLGMAPPHSVMMRAETSPIRRIAPVLIRSATTADLLRLAVATERFRLATGNLPQETLELVPLYIPRIPMDTDGKPLRYLKRDDGFHVWSVGLDKLDTWQGVRPPPPKGRALNEPDERDWLLEVTHH